jgi:hypothetical protein
MIKHIVFWKLKETANGKNRAENAELIKQKLEALNGKIDGMIKLEAGIDFSKTESSCDLALYSEFVSRAALDGYQNHPLHKEVMPFVAEVRDLRFLVDYEI